MTPADYHALVANKITFVKELPNGEALGIMQMMFTFALVVIDKEPAVRDANLDLLYRRRFCFEDPLSAIDAARAWDGTDGTDPPGPWIKEKSPGVDRLNPRVADDDFERSPHA